MCFVEDIIATTQFGIGLGLTATLLVLRQLLSQGNTFWPNLLWFFLLQTSRNSSGGKVNLNLHGATAFYHCYIWVPGFYPLNSNVEIALQCDSSVIVLE